MASPSRDGGHWTHTLIRMAGWTRGFQPRQGSLGPGLDGDCVSKSLQLSEMPLPGFAPLRTGVLGGLRDDPARNGPCPAVLRRIIGHTIRVAL